MKKNNNILHPEVSIIMPVYNSSAFLFQSITSIRNQSFSNFELICVDDGSTDDSYEKLEHFAALDNRIRIFKQNNQYAGAARNKGIKEARGNFLIFLDSDDIFDKNMLKCFVKIARKTSSDIVICGFKVFKQHKLFARKSKINIESDKILNPFDLKENIFQIDPGVPWNKFYKKDFIIDNKLSFQELRNTNDIYFTKLSLIKANSIYCCTKTLVNYRSGNAASLQGGFSNAPKCFVQALTAIFETLKRDNSVHYLPSFYQYCFDLLDSKIRLITGLSRIVEVIDELKVFLNQLKEYNPRVFDEVHKPEYVCDIMNSNYCGVIYILYTEYLASSVPKQSIEYRIGRFVLSILKKSRENS